MQYFLTWFRSSQPTRQRTEGMNKRPFKLTGVRIAKKTNNETRKICCLRLVNFPKIPEKTKKSFSCVNMHQCLSFLGFFTGCCVHTKGKNSFDKKGDAGAAAHSSRITLCLRLKKKTFHMNVLCKHILRHIYGTIECTADALLSQ